MRVWVSHEPRNTCIRESGVFVGTKKKRTIQFSDPTNFHGYNDAHD